MLLIIEKASEKKILKIDEKLMYEDQKIQDLYDRNIEESMFFNSPYAQFKGVL